MATRYQPRELLETPESMVIHNAVSDHKREGSKMNMIGQSAAKRLGDQPKVQRLVGVVFCYVSDTYSHDRRNNREREATDVQGMW